MCGRRKHNTRSIAPKVGCPQIQLYLQSHLFKFQSNTRGHLYFHMLSCLKAYLYTIILYMENSFQLSFNVADLGSFISTKLLGKEHNRSVEIDEVVIAMLYFQRKKYILHVLSFCEIISNTFI